MASSASRRALWGALLFTFIVLFYLRGSYSESITDAPDAVLPTNPIAPDNQSPNPETDSSSFSTFFTNPLSRSRASSSSVFDYTKLLTPAWHPTVQGRDQPPLHDKTRTLLTLALSQRLQHLAQLILLSETPSGQAQRRATLEIEAFTHSLAPFLHADRVDTPITGSSSNELDRPFQTLRHNTEQGSKGIIIPLRSTKGKVGENFRSALHLIASLRGENILKCTLPIQIAYEGDAALPKKFHDALTSLGADISLVDVNAAFSSNGKARRTTKATSRADLAPLALLASKFEHAIILSPSIVLLQDPAVVFDFEGYKETGMFIFHPSNATVLSAEQRIDARRASLALQQKVLGSSSTGEAEEEEEEEEQQQREDAVDAESEAMVVLDKSRAEVLAAALVIAWQGSLPPTPASLKAKKSGTQNPKPRRMSWREAFESCTVTYASSTDYVVIAATSTVEGTTEAVCHTELSYLDPTNTQKVLWYARNLVKGKKLDVPGVVMEGGDCEGKKADRCVFSGRLQVVGAEQMGLARRIVEAAEEVDKRFERLIRKAR